MASFHGFCFNACMKLLCFAKSRGDAPSTRQRVIGLIDVAKKENWKTTFVFAPAYPWWNMFPIRWFRFFSFWKLLRSADTQTVVLLQRTLRCPEFLWLVGRYKSTFGRVIVDFDDAVWTHSKTDADRLIALADEVWCGSQAIVEYVKSQHGNAIFLPTTVDTVRFDLPHIPETPPVIGWTGDEIAHRPNLLSFADMLREIHQTLPVFTLRLIGVDALKEEMKRAFGFLGDRLDLPGKVPSESIPEHVSRFSIGIMPLDDTPFNRGKSALKLVEYLAAGVSVGASDVGENRFVVRAPEFGFVAVNAKEWQKGLSALLSDVTTAEQKGQKGRAFVREHYDRTTVYTKELDRLRALLTA